MASLQSAVPLLRYLGDRFAEFFGEVADTIEAYASTGKLPHDVVDQASDPKTKKKKTQGEPKVKRPLTGYNLFIRDTIEHMKANGITATTEEGQKGNFLLKAVGEWKAMSQEEKDAYSAKAKKDAVDANPGSDGNEQIPGENEAEKAEAIAPETPDAAPTENAATKPPEQPAGQATEAVWTSPPRLHLEQEEAEPAPLVKKKKKSKKRKAVQLDGDAQRPVAHLPGILEGDTDEGDEAAIPDTQVDEEDGVPLQCTQVGEVETCAPHEPSSDRKKKKKKNKDKKRRLEAGG